MAAPPTSSSQRRQRDVRLVRATHEGAWPVEDTVVVEEPLEIVAHGPGQPEHTLVTTLRTPGHEAELAVGWMFSEGLLVPGEVAQVSFGDPVTMAQPEDRIVVELTRPLDIDAGARRHATATASCGVCGRAAIDELALRCAPVAPDALTDPPVAWSLVASLPDRLREEQQLFGSTGGLHATGMFTAAGTLVTLREDVGRHNALDAAIGAHVIADDVPMDRYIAVLSGRVGFELVVKAAAASIPMIVAVGAPTDLAVRTAESFGVTVVGFLRNGAGNVYTHPHRLDTDR